MFKPPFNVRVVIHQLLRLNPFPVLSVLAANLVSNLIDVLRTVLLATMLNLLGQVLLATNNIGSNKGILDQGMMVEAIPTLLGPVPAPCFRVNPLLISTRCLSPVGIGLTATVNLYILGPQPQLVEDAPRRQHATGRHDAHWVGLGWEPQHPLAVLEVLFLLMRAELITECLGLDLVLKRPAIHHVIDVGMDAADLPRLSGCHWMRVGLAFVVAQELDHLTERVTSHNAVCVKEEEVLASTVLDAIILGSPVALCLVVLEVLDEALSEEHCADASLFLWTEEISSRPNRILSVSRLVHDVVMAHVVNENDLVLAESIQFLDDGLRCKHNVRAFITKRNDN